MKFFKLLTFRSLGKKLFLGCNTSKRHGEDSYEFQNGRKRISTYKCSSALMKGSPVAYSEKEMCLVFSQAEGNSKALLVKLNVASIFQSGVPFSDE